MKQMASILVLALAPALFAAPRQAAQDPATQAGSDSPSSPSSRATSHDRHARKHRAGNHHHRRHTTAKSHSS
jgi:Ni/Co efflux regulator RcnB